MTTTELWSGGVKFTVSENVFPLTTDSILLADFANAGSAGVKNILDIGCGSGIVGLLLAWNNTDAHLTGIDISEDAVACARENIEQNGFGGRFEVVCGDIKTADFPGGLFELAVCNPPYFEKGRGKPGGFMREESTATLRDITEAAAKLLCPGGVFCLVMRFERLGDTLEILTELEFSPERLRLVQHTETAPPSMALVSARLGTTTELEVQPPLILKDKNNCDSEEIRRIYRMT